MRIGTALHCRIQPSIFHRKNYFYPDMPKDYQISQYDVPINVDGWLELPDGRRVGIVRAHMEEDTGKTTHVGGGGRIHDAAHSLVDYNRAGVPLVEIVSAPDMRSADEARTYVDELRAILVATGASDGKMEEGSLRVDANVSVRPAGSTEFGTRCEIKNLNSLRSLGRAIDYEAARQIELITSGGAGRPGDPALGRGDGADRFDALQGGGVRLPVLPRARPGAGRARRPDWIAAVAGVAPGPAGRPAGGGGRRVADSTPTPTRSSRWCASASTVTWTPWSRPAATPAWRCVAWPTRWPPTSTRSIDLTARPSSALVAMEADGIADHGPGPRRAQRAARIRWRPRRDGGPAGIRGPGRRRSGCGRRRGDRRPPRGVGPLRAGEDKLTGFFIGQIKAATAGKADLKAAASLLRARRG